MQVTVIHSSKQQKASAHTTTTTHPAASQPRVEQAQCSCARACHKTPAAAAAAVAKAPQAAAQQPAAVGAALATERHIAYWLQALTRAAGAVALHPAAAAAPQPHAARHEMMAPVWGGEHHEHHDGQPCTA